MAALSLSQEIETVEDLTSLLDCVINNLNTLSIGYDEKQGHIFADTTYKDIKYHLSLAMSTLETKLSMLETEKESNNDT